MGVSDRPQSPDGKTIMPLTAHGVTMMSIGLMLRGDEAVIWRGPMLHKAVEQFLKDVFWDAPDYLVVDMPPGFSDDPWSPTRELEAAITARCVAACEQQWSGDPSVQVNNCAFDDVWLLSTPAEGALRRISPLRMSGRTICWPILGLARPGMAVIEERAEMISGGPMTIPVRVPGRPSLERLRVRMTCASQCGVERS